MSALLSNADCGPVNALSQLQKHNDVDRSIQLDRTSVPSTLVERFNHLPLTAPASASSSGQAHAARFFSNQLAEPRIQETRSLQGLAWAREFPRPSSSSSASHDYPVYAAMEAALLRAQDRSRPSPSSDIDFKQSAWAAEFQPLSAPYAPLSATVPTQARITEIPQSMWDQEFARIETQPPVFDAKGKGRASASMDAALEEAFARVTLQPEEEYGSQSIQRDFNAEFESVWTQIRHDAVKAHEEPDLASWEAEFSANRMEENDPEWDLSEMERRYQELTAAARDMDDAGPTTRYDENGLPDLGDYEFELENPYLSGHLRDTLTALLQESLASSDPSALTRSALIIEAMIQTDGLDNDHASQFQLWYTLGQVLVRDERDDKGIKALARAVEGSVGQPEGNSAILELAIAYVNQSYDMACFLTLSRFLRATHLSHANLLDPKSLQSQALWSVRDLVKDAFLSLAGEQHRNNTVDPEIQMGLGVLLYSEAEYDRAAECFQAALSINPENAVLWNRLGSCLSNGNRPEEAIGSYQRALEIWPNYTRAVVNIGVACLNMGAHKEAVEHFLSAIAMHDGSGSKAPSGAIPRGVKSNEDIWKTLRRTFLAMDRHDLAERALAPDRSAESFRGEGFDF
ncbi:TPR-like protein [Calocera cornea HHB12733]|uniref:TPR-like protein n=1 Tax=Calocera cornea HHB12733 TaxID=1353952 RepID=A0A165F4A4_9BASI|nr:TPR-like protein [Calocera cornea HHB12733]